MLIIIAIIIIICIIEDIKNKEKDNNIIYVFPGDYLYYNKSLEKDLGISIIRLDYINFDEKYKFL